jgi:transposase
LFEKINFALLLQAREAAGREPSPSAGVIDSQSVKTTESGGPRGYDAAKKIKGRKRHIVTDTCGLLVGAEVHPADVQDRDGAVLVIEAVHQLFPWLRHLFADSVYNGPNLPEALAKFGKWTIEIVKRAADAVGFQLLPRRWVVERTLAWLNRNRRLAKDFEASIASAKAWVYIASVQLLIRRLA